jgi:hypothetical protein
MGPAAMMPKMTKGTAEVRYPMSPVLNVTKRRRDYIEGCCNTDCASENADCSPTAVPLLADGEDDGKVGRQGGTTSPRWKSACLAKVVRIQANKMQDKNLAIRGNSAGKHVGVTRKATGGKPSHAQYS